MDLYTRLKLPIYTPYETIYYYCTRLNYDGLKGCEIESFDILTDEEKLKSYMRSLVELKDNKNEKMVNDIYYKILKSKTPRYYVIENGYNVMPKGMYDYIYMNYENERKKYNILTLSYDKMMIENDLSYNGFEGISAKEKKIFTECCRSLLLRSKPLDVITIVHNIIKVGIDVSVLKSNNCFFKNSASMGIISYIYSVGCDFMKYRQNQKFRNETEKKLYAKKFWCDLKHTSLTAVNVGVSGFCSYLVYGVFTGLAGVIGCTVGSVVVFVGVSYVMKKLTEYLEGDEREEVEEDIEKLETIKEAARMIFENYDDDDDDKISKDQCKKMIKEIYKLSKLQYPDNLDDIVNELRSRDGSIHWNMFWSWLTYRLFDPDNKNRECENINLNDEDIYLIENIEMWSNLKLWLFSFCNDASTYSIWRFLTDWKIEYPMVKNRNQLIHKCITEIPYIIFLLLFIDLISVKS